MNWQQVVFDSVCVIAGVFVLSTAVAIVAVIVVIRREDKNWNSWRNG